MCLPVDGVTAQHIGAVTDCGIGPLVKTSEVTLARLGVDGRLDQVLLHPADPLRLSALFGISPATAVRYARNGAQLTARPSEGSP